MKRPLLSICIPTYNRAEALWQSLELMAHNKEFNEEIEIVISDNASTDSTKEVGAHFSKMYKNIKYFRNDENIRDKNFSLSLDRANGEYLKLMKDNLIIAERGLTYLKKAIKENLEDKKSLFFTNGFLYNSPMMDVFFCKDFNDFILHTSYRITAITFFGCWREQWSKVLNREKFSNLQLAQDDWVYQILEQRPESILYTKKYFSLITEVGKRGGYNWFEVHVGNYYQILKPYTDKGLVSVETIKKEKKTYLKGLKLQLVHKYLWKIYSSWEFDFSGSTSILWKHFKGIPYYHWLMVTLPVWGVWEGLKFKIKELLIHLGMRDKINKLLVYRNL